MKVLLVILAILIPIPFAPIALIILNTNNKSTRGLSAEYKVSNSLKKKLHPDYYKVLDNVCLPSNGNTAITQIDHIVVSSFGVFCIETKSHKGWIVGNAKSKYWTQVLFKKKYKIYNPLRQNYAHTKAIENALSGTIDHPLVVSLVVFTRAEKIKIYGTDNVGGISYIVDRIKNYQRPIFAPDRCQDIYNQLCLVNITDEEKIEQHNRDVGVLSSNQY